MDTTAAFTPGVYTDVRVIPAMLQALRESPPSGIGVLSAYLPTPPVTVLGQKYLVRFREECKAIRQQMESAGRGERQAFEAAYTRIEEHLLNMPLPRFPGLAVFATEERGSLAAVPLPERPATVIVWDTQPVLTPLEEVVDEHERIAVALVDRQQARLFTIFLGEIEEQRTVRGGELGKPTVSGIAGNYARRYRENVRRHLRETTHAMVELLRGRPFDRLILGGPADVDTMLKDELPRSLRARFAGTLPIALEATDAEVLDAARAMAEEIERRTEAEMVRELIAARTMPRAALGLTQTLNALATHRVHHLFLASGFTVSGDDPRFQQAVAASEPRETTATEPVSDTREWLMDRALEQAARVEIVSGEAATLLDEYDGIGAWNRW